jgi:hypothetical protein
MNRAMSPARRCPRKGQCLFFALEVVKGNELEDEDRLFGERSSLERKSNQEQDLSVAQGITASASHD